MNWPPVLENDTWWWELVRLDELHLPKSWNFIIPDKLVHFLTCFCLTWALYKWLGRNWAAAVAWFVMMVPWELVWDGMFRYGFSLRDALADTLGCAICWWWLATYSHVGQSQIGG